MRESMVGLIASALARSPARIGPSRTSVASTPDWAGLSPSSAAVARRRRAVRMTALRRRVTDSSSMGALSVTSTRALSCLPIGNIIAPGATRRDATG